MSNRKKGGDGQNAEKLEEEERLQAVVLADSFQRCFAPVTYERPKALLPLCGAPMLDYVLEALARAKIDDVFLFVTSQESLFKEYIKARRWNHQMKVEVVVAQQARSIGDALREIDARGLIRSDFILMRGDVVTSVDLGETLKQHKARRAKKTSAIMTCLLKEGAPHLRQRCVDEDIVVVLDSSTHQLLHLEHLNLNSDSNGSKNAAVDTSIFAQHESVNVRYDLIDSHIAICAPEVLVAFTDNFDWQDVQSDFIKGVLKSEILGHTVFASVVREYAARVHSLAAYDAVSKDILRRWTYPLVLDFNLFGDMSFEYTRPSFYKEHHVNLSQSCQISEECAIMAGTTVGGHAKIVRSFIGRDCVIGAGAVVIGSYIWDGVTIGSGARVEAAMICDGAHIGDGAVVEKGAIISFNVVVAPGHTVASYKRLTCGSRKPTDEDDDEDWGSDDGGEGEKADDILEQVDEKEVGVGGRGYKWTAGEDEDDRMENSIVFDRPPNDDDDESDWGSDSDSESDGEGGDEELFFHEVSETVRRGMQQEHSNDNLVLEVNRLRIAHDKSAAECGAAVLSSLVTLTVANATAGGATPDTKTLLRAIVATIDKWKAVVAKYTQAHTDSTFDETSAIHALEKACYGIAQCKPMFHILLKRLYDDDIVTEEGILDWGKEADDRDEMGIFFRAQASKLIDWLQNAEEESD